MSRKKSISPYWILLNSFIVIIFIGTVLLTLPVSSATGERITIVDSLFTTTSAVAVTGLVVNDVSTTFSLFGKTVIIVLIQLGGLGIMTFSSIIVLLVSKKISYRTKKIVQEDLNYNTLFDIQKYIKNVVKTVLFIEFVGAFCLFFTFIKKYSFWKAVYYSVFHSVSAFCNAGFTLFSSNLEGYKSSTPVNLVICALIILGGIGFAALNNIHLYIRKKIKGNQNKIRLSLTTKMAVLMSVVLIIAGTLITFIVESYNPATLQSFSMHDKILASLFQSVTTRTAGFQTLNLADMRIATLILYIFLMYIGASPGSTGGGIKTTTLGVIILGVYSTLTNREDIEIKRKKIAWDVFNKATSIIFISLTYIICIVFLLSILEDNAGFLDLVFETVSAFGTVGLSLNLTPELGSVSKLLIALTMFIGRVGPLTVAMALSEYSKRKGIYKYPVEDVQVG
jgi:trk system potassium uptake protein TrkH